MRRQFAAVAVTVLFAAPALALDMPTRKAGLWEMKMVFEGLPVPAQTMRQCIDQATDQAMQSQFGAAAQGTCSKQDIKNAGGTMTFDAVCQIGPATTTMQGVVTGSFDSNYTMKITTKSTGGPPIPGMTPGGETKMTIEAKHLGACQAGQKPGDMIMSNGMKMNVLDLQKMMDGITPPGGMTPGR